MESCDDHFLPFVGFQLGHSWHLFLYFRRFNTVDSTCKFSLRLYSNHGPLVSEATALLTEPQIQPFVIHFLSLMHATLEKKDVK